MQGFLFVAEVSSITVFIQGALSFFSPCVLPLLPVYLGYLSGSTLRRDENGAWTCNRKKVLWNTVFFVLGISCVFFALGLGMTALGRFLGANRRLIAMIGGVIVIMFGLYQLGVFGQSNLFSREKRLSVRMDKAALSPFTAFLLGLLFSFAWTPCVGPTLASVLLLAGSSSSMAKGLGFTALYTMGFVIPFLAVGMFTSSLLSFIKKHTNVVRWTGKVCAVLMIFMGILMITGTFQSFSIGLSSSASAEENLPDAQETQESTPLPEPEYPAYDFTLTDQFGDEHTLSDYRGKIIFLNFWATWCPPCRAEMPDIQSLYEKYASEPESNVIILGVAFPGSYGEMDEEGIRDFLEENGYTYPVLMDAQETLAREYMITAFPTTYLIDALGGLYGRIVGAISEDVMEDAILQTLAACQ